MRTALDCIPCVLRQTLDVARRVTDDVVLQDQIMRRALKIAHEMDCSQEPPRLGQLIHRMVRKATGTPDPYLQVKRTSNQQAQRLYPGMKQEVHLSNDPLATAVRFAIAGNIIDFGCHSTVDETDIQQSIREAMATRLEPSLISRFKKAVHEARHILYLADNAGEIVFDRLLIEQLPTRRVTLAVRGQPIINDATREDARLVGLTSLVRVIDNGCDIPGTVPELCSFTFREQYERSDLIIAKGQGNFETLDGRDKHIFFLLKAKCRVVARRIGSRVGDMVIHESRPGARAVTEPLSAPGGERIIEA